MQKARQDESTRGYIIPCPWYLKLENNAEKIKNSDHKAFASELQFFQTSFM